MLIAGIIVVCIILLALGFLLPRFTAPQSGVNKALGGGGRTAGKAPGKLGTWLAKPFHKSNRAANKSASAGRKGRGKLPL